MARDAKTFSSLEWAKVDLVQMPNIFVKPPGSKSREIHGVNDIRQWRAIVMEKHLIETDEPTTILSAGETDAGSAEVQPARDSQTRATNCRGDGGSTSAVPLSDAQFRAFLCLKKPFAEGKVRS